MDTDSDGVGPSYLLYGLQMIAFDIIRACLAFAMLVCDFFFGKCHTRN